MKDEKEDNSSMVCGHDDKERPVNPSRGQKSRRGEVPVRKGVKNKLS